MLKFDWRKVAKIFGLFLLAVLVLLFLVVWWTKGKIERGEVIKWEGKWMTIEEFHKIIPPQTYKVESKNKPEDVYTDFRQALLDDNIERALRLIRAEKRETYRAAFEDKVKLGEWVKKLPEGIVLENQYENLAYFDLNVGDDYKHTIGFIKNRDGYWEIDAI